MGVEIATAKKYFEQPVVVEHYAQAANRVGLWASEEKIFTRLFKTEDSILELGCGAGRIALGLWELGYRHLLGIDYARAMISEARRINQVLEYGVAFQVGDATQIKFPDGSFEEGKVSLFVGYIAKKLQHIRNGIIIEGDARMVSAADREELRPAAIVILPIKQIAHTGSDR